MKNNQTIRSKGKRGKERDISSKTIFDNPILCAQFLRDNVKVPLFENVQPEDIEDVSDRYRPYMGTEFLADTVKRIKLYDDTQKEREPLFLVSLIEHKSTVDYNVSMQLLRYIMCIWTEYGKEMEQKTPGITSRKSFRYPAIVPVVYYEGKASWTADRKLCGRISRGELFKKWLPDFTYEVIRIHDYTDEELLDRGNEMALIMLFNKIQDVEDLTEFLKLPKEKLSHMIQNTSEGIINIITSVMESLCNKIGATEEETESCVQKVKESKMGYLFENIAKMDIQEERRNTAEARAQLEKAKQELEAAKQETEVVKQEAEAVRRESEMYKENMIREMVSFCRELGSDKDAAAEKIMTVCQIDQTTAQEKVDLYWNHHAGEQEGR